MIWWYHWFDWFVTTFCKKSWYRICEYSMLHVFIKNRDMIWNVWCYVALNRKLNYNSCLVMVYTPIIFLVSNTASNYGIQRVSTHIERNISMVYGHVYLLQKKCRILFLNELYKWVALSRIWTYQLILSLYLIHL